VIAAITILVCLFLWGIGPDRLRRQKA